MNEFEEVPIIDFESSEYKQGYKDGFNPENKMKVCLDTTMKTNWNKWTFQQRENYSEGVNNGVSDYEVA